jgi:hypothetical protein
MKEFLLTKSVRPRARLREGQIQGSTEMRIQQSLPSVCLWLGHGAIKIENQMVWKVFHTQQVPNRSQVEFGF